MQPKKAKSGNPAAGQTGTLRKRSPESHERAHDDHQKVVIGWSENVDFPAWGISGLRAKVDTGARTSALHVENLEILPGNIACFEVILSRSENGKRVHVKAPVVKHARVRSSSGHFSVRYFVRAVVRVGPVEKEIEISLVSREEMVFRMLLGRKALERDFVVDVTKRHALRDGARKTVRKKS